MKSALRVLAGLNALFQLVVGVLSVLAPTVAAGAFGVPADGAATLALVRMFGGLLASTGAISALFAREPDRERSLVVVFAGCLFFNVLTDVLVIGTGELRFDQVAAGMLLELVLAVVLVARQLGAPKVATAS